MYLYPAGMRPRPNRKLGALTVDRSSNVRVRGWVPAPPTVTTYTPPGAARVTGPVTIAPNPRLCPPGALCMPPRYPPVPAPTAAVPGSPVPANYPTNQIFVNTDGTQWQFNTPSGQWVQITSPYIGAGGATFPGTPVPSGFPTNQIFTAADGTQWQFNPAMGAWINIGSSFAQGSTSTSSLSPSGSPVSVTVAPSSSTYQSVLDWLSQNTLISAVPNWLPVAGFGLLAFKFLGKGR
jgi:hypothetical protein